MARWTEIEISAWNTVVDLAQADDQIEPKNPGRLRKYRLAFIAAAGLNTLLPPEVPGLEQYRFSDQTGREREVFDGFNAEFMAAWYFGFMPLEKK